MPQAANALVDGMHLPMLGACHQPTFELIYPRNARSKTSRRTFESGRPRSFASPFESFSRSKWVLLSLHP